MSSALLILLMVTGIAIYAYVPFVPELFKLNKACQEEGYYMAEFEFKMLGLAYLLDHGHYLKALEGMRRLHRQLKTREGLVKLPKSANTQQELAFYLSLQNPRTGAFMDDWFPQCTYHGPTGNVLLHLEALAKELGQPLKLKYPLTYLNTFNTPEKLKTYLDDVSTVGWIGSRFPQTSFHFARDILALHHDGLLTRNNLYTFSTEWEQALITWFYQNQDAQTGFWGPKSRTNGQLTKQDLNNTASIVKTFVDREGNNIHDAYPLRRQNQMFTTALQILSAPTPADSQLDAWHEWALKTGKGTYLLTRYLWPSASKENRIKAQAVFEKGMRIRFEKYYIPEEGAFAYYPQSKHATLDGTGSALGYLSYMGAFSPANQQKLWGNSAETYMELDPICITTEDAFATITNLDNVNSWRIYAADPDPDHYTTHAIGVFYVQDTPVLDIVELMPKIQNWLQRTHQSMGNWISREDVEDRIAGIHIKPIPVSKGNIPKEQITQVLQHHNTLTAIGFDVLQVPRYKITINQK